MDRLTPAPSFRTTRPPTRSRNRTRPMSPSPRPNLRRPFTDSVPSTMFITTDYDYDYISPSSPDSDLIFNMSPIQSHILPSSPPGREPINVMTLRNKTQRKNNSPPLSPLLYSFPRPSRLHPYMKQSTATPKDILPSKPLSSISQNLGALTLDSMRSTLSSHGTEAGPTSEARPLAASLVDSIMPHPPTHDVITPSNPTRSPLDSNPSSPIPIPRHTPRQSDPGPFVSHTITISSHPLSTHPSPNVDCTPLPSSGIASHVASAGVRGAGKTASSNASPAGSSAFLEPIRIEGFDDSECDPLEADDGKMGDTFPDFRPSVVSSTASSFSDSTPFRFSRFLDPEPEDQPSGNADQSAERGTFLMQRKPASENRDTYSHRGCIGS